MESYRSLQQLTVTYCVLSLHLFKRVLLLVISERTESRSTNKNSDALDYKNARVAKQIEEKSSP